MKVQIDKNTCLNCGTCVAIAGKTFRFDSNQQIEVIDPSGDSEDVIKEAIESCPVGAIKEIKEEKNG